MHDIYVMIPWWSWTRSRSIGENQTPSRSKNQATNIWLNKGSNLQPDTLLNYTLWFHHGGTAFTYQSNICSWSQWTWKKTLTDFYLFWNTRIGSSPTKTRLVFNKSRPNINLIPFRHGQLNTTNTHLYRIGKMVLQCQFKISK